MFVWHDVFGFSDEETCSKRARLLQKSMDLDGQISILISEELQASIQKRRGVLVDAAVNGGSRVIFDFFAPVSQKTVSATGFGILDETGFPCSCHVSHV